MAAATLLGRARLPLTSFNRNDLSSKGTVSCMRASVYRKSLSSQSPIVRPAFSGLGTFFESGGEFLLPPTDVGLPMPLKAGLCPIGTEVNDSILLSRAQETLSESTPSASLVLTNSQ